MSAHCNNYMNLSYFDSIVDRADIARKEARENEVQPVCGFCKGSGKDDSIDAAQECIFCNGLGYGTGNAGEPLKYQAPTQTPAEQAREAFAEEKGRATYILTLFPESPQIGGWSFLLGHGPHHFSSQNFPTAERAAKAAADFLEEFIQDPEVFISNHCNP